MTRLACILIPLLSLHPLHAEPTSPPPRETAEFGTAFEKQKAVGTFVLLDPATGNIQVWNPERARTRFIPASTFKIANSLIGLDTGTVKSLDEILPYGGKPQPFKEWEQDLPLRQAIKVSSVPIYQELARRIGAERMAKGVKSLDYGNADPGKVIDRFWLDGPLMISATEQAVFLRRLLADDLPLEKETMQQVRGILSTEPSPSGLIHFKTGWCTATTPQIGWIVGWVDRNGSHHPFALNIDMADLKDAPKRMLILKDCLATAK
jgi:beta-lactamase class D